MIPAALGVGFVCYGISIVFDVYALRYLGAAREAAFLRPRRFLARWRPFRCSAID